MGGYHWSGAAWRGGWWHGGWWPRAYYGAGFAWFLPVLPLAYATYYYGGVPYYYANNAYYTWDPSYSGYVATDPPPLGGDPSGAGPAGPADASQGAPQSAPIPYGAPNAAPYGAPQPGAASPQALPAPDNGQPAPGAQPQAYPMPNAAPPATDPVSLGVQANLNMVPRNGQTSDQVSMDRRGCQQWAAQQAGASAANGSDYQRAMVACVEGRGYGVE